MFRTIFYKGLIVSCVTTIATTYVPFQVAKVNFFVVI